MSNKLKLIRIFIGSPGGLEEERQAAHAVVESVNRSHGEKWGCYFRLLGWEDAVPGFARPQSKINEDLDRCDYFIGVLWNKWGTPPSTDPDGPTSGFEEEYIRAKMRIENGLMKDMAIYFKDVLVPSGLEPGEEIRKVLLFRKTCIEEKKVFFKNFSDVHSFRDVVREKLEEIGWSEADHYSDEGQESNQSKKAPSFQESSSDAPEPDAWLIDEQARTFLITLAQRSHGWDDTAPYEVARLRLIGTAVSRSGNDDSYLGNHDANLIFQHLRNATLSMQEVRALIDCGVVGFKHQNVPLWRWLEKGSDKEEIWRRVAVLAAVGTDEEKRNAIDILRLSSQPIPSLDENFGKEDVLIQWLSDDVDSGVFDSASEFLSSNANRHDLTLLEEAAKRCSPYRRAKLETVIVSVLARTSLNDALLRLVEKEIDKTDEALAVELFKNPPSLSTSTMHLCLSAKSDPIRLRAAKVLAARDEITPDIAQTLLTDSNYDVRLLAAESMKKLGLELSDDLVRMALRIVKPSPSRNFSFIAARETDDTYYERYLASRLYEMDYTALKAEVDKAAVYDLRELTVYYSKYWMKNHIEAKEKLKDCFKNHFDTKVKEAIKRGTLDANGEAQIKRIELFYRKKLCSAVLDILCKARNANDIYLVRDVVGKIEIDATEEILGYLARFGEWQDIDRIKKLGDYPSEGAGLLSFLTTKLPNQKAAAILALCKDRIADMLALELDSDVRKSIAKQLRSKVIANLSDEVLLRELNRKEDTYRIIFALRCVEVLPKARIKALLDRYVDVNEHRFYNSVHWLDLGASLPSRQARSIAKRALELQ